ncbi:MAG: prohibitin family protein [Moraxellaceae bacterium]|nr:MAG: prohibitin family protein [Moraxellaceae bacterium]
MLIDQLNRTAYPAGSRMRRAGFIAVAVVGFMLLWGSFYTVNTGTRAIIFRFGQIIDVTDEGLHLKLPFIDKRLIVDVRTQKASSPASAGTRDMQSVTTEVAVNYHLNAASLAKIYAQSGLEVREKLIDPRIQEVVKAVVAKYSAEQLLVQREAVKTDIFTNLKNSLAKYSIVVEDIQITNFSFSPAFDKAIELKQTAEQSALKAKNDLQRIRIEAEQKISMAEAEAKAIEIQSLADKAQGGEGYVQLKAIEKWDGKLPQYSGSAAVPFIQLKPAQ